MYFCLNWTVKDYVEFISLMQECGCYTCFVLFELSSDFLQLLSLSGHYTEGVMGGEFHKIEAIAVTFSFPRSHVCNLFSGTSAQSLFPPTPVRCTHKTKVIEFVCFAIYILLLALFIFACFTSCACHCEASSADFKHFQCYFRDLI